MKTIKSERGDVVGFILVLAVIMVIGVYFFPYIIFQSKYANNETVNSVDIAVKEIDDKSVITPSLIHDESKYLIGREVSGFIHSLEVKTGPKGPPYLYHYNDMIQLTALPKANSGYKIAEPLKCTWEGYPAYTGTSCNAAPEKKFSVGTHRINVRLCDQNGACANGQRIITVGYKDPIQSIAEDWDNYIQNGGLSGDWKFDASTMTIYSTKNVGWTGYTNPLDKDLQNYKLSFAMGVIPGDGDDDAIGFTFRQQDASNMYVFSVDNRDSNGGVGGYHSGLYRIKNGVKTTLVNLLPLKWEPNTYMNIKIEVIDNHIVIYSDGKKVVDCYDSNPVLKGSYGPFTMSQANGRFKNLEVEVLK